MISDTGSKRSGLTGLPAFIVFAVVTAFVYYSPFLHNFFAGDDFLALESLMHGPQRVIVGYDNNLRLFSNLFWWPQFLLFRLDPFGYNLFSLLLYILNGILLYRLLQRLFDDRLLSFLAAGIFVAGSVGADAVLWRAASATLINMTCYLLSLHAYVLYRQKQQARYRYLSLLLFLLAMLSKEEAASLPFILLLLDLFIFREQNRPRELAVRILPYVFIVIACVLANYLTIHHLLHARSFMAGIARVRPLYSLFAGWTVFFLSPAGLLSFSDPLLYATVAFIPASFYLVRDRRILLLGYLWIFFTFLPQSLSGQSHFGLDMLANSLSRHLYLPSVGSSLVLASVLTSLRQKQTARLHLAGCILFLAVYCFVQYLRVQGRGESWKLEGEYVARFIVELQRQLPRLPENTYFTVTDPPVGRAFVQAIMRTHYGTTSIHWRDDLKAMRALPEGARGILIDYAWKDNYINGSPARIYVVENAPARKQGEQK